MFKRFIESVKSAVKDYGTFVMTMEFCYVCSYPWTGDLMVEVGTHKVCPRCDDRINEMMEYRSEA